MAKRIADEDDEDRPRPKKRPPTEEIKAERPRPKPLPKSADNDAKSKPIARRQPVEDEDEDRPRRRRPVDEEDDTDDKRPRRRRSRDEDDDDDRRRRRRARDDDDDEDDDDRPRRRREDSDDRRPRRLRGAAAASAPVTLVAIFNLAYSALITAAAIAIMIGGASVIGWFTGHVDKTQIAIQNAPGFQLNPNAKKNAENVKAVADGVATGLLVVFILSGSCMIVFGGIPLLLAGLGVFKRAQWGRILTLVLGGLDLMHAFWFLFNNFPMNMYGMLWFSAHVVYGATVFAILLIPKYGEEFS